MENKVSFDLKSNLFNNKITKEERNKQARTILEFNRKKLYKIAKKKFRYLDECLDEYVKDFLLDIIAYWLKKDCIAYGSHPLVYFLGTAKATYVVRKKSSTDVTSRYLNYLCALGLLKKLPQNVDYTLPGKPCRRRYMRKQQITIVNRNMMRFKSFTINPINTFEVFKYTTEELEACNERAKRLLSAKITRGNISYNQLAINGLQDIAEEIYLENRDLTVEKKEREYEYLNQCIDLLLDTKGYTTKQDIYNHCYSCIEEKELDKLFKIYKNDLWKDKSYKRPSKAEKAEYGLQDDTWIIKRK